MIIKLILFLLGVSELAVASRMVVPCHHLLSDVSCLQHLSLLGLNTELTTVLTSRDPLTDLYAAAAFAKVQPVSSLMKAELVSHSFRIMSQKPYNFFSQCEYSNNGFFVFSGALNRALVMRMSDGAFFMGKVPTGHAEDWAEQIPALIGSGALAPL